ncbi:chromate transporter-domain-containing protein [Durotheca rogersii]|uniref:chromate transporter-domain-containing protein n=1 Tax=Durotheca rogersii TaxID=419775 RepID=UPI00221E5B8E|nr:chromate transporter-domain-containing protein [Durotheca rogersii]KAI5862478.1 chromate transporter-domain-containing protein [Durotheca rogersii]
MGVSDWRQTLGPYGHHAVDILRAEWYLGLTSFGGPPVHFKIFHDKFVVKLKWIDDQLYQELFSISQALSGPASTKMLYCINLIHDGVLGALIGFLFWSLPGALGMYALSIGVSSIGSTLPRAVYALLSGLNAATVGIIALAAVELSRKAVTDKVTRTLVFLSGAAGLLYNALWYFPVLILASGVVTVVHDKRWLHRPVNATLTAVGFRKRKTAPAEEEGLDPRTHVQLDPLKGAGEFPVGQQPSAAGPSPELRVAERADDGAEERDLAPGARRENEPSRTESEPRVIPREHQLNFSWKTGSAVIALFLTSFVAVMVARGVLAHPPLLYRLFANLYLAGTIIFGGGPVVIPLLREYVVAEGWVSPRDFLIGLALAQAFPGPNFNFAVFLGGLTAANSGLPSAAGAAAAFVGIFFPGMALVQGTMGVWSSLRSRPCVKSAVKGVNASAVGLIYTAVYRIWLVGYLDEGFQSGRSLGDDPWWVVVTTTAYVGGRYYGLSAPVVIILGAALGLVRYGVVSGRG